ncbi:hypothetical protein HB834_05765 [Listeria booriae]|uniref:hypothetical protein n=1 Tax=Listeria booriae TaxID=1552123 RepID=UPI00164D37EA|nr:hypothetical protein [Listeria booriae]MBC6151103.1 hypothetical protein [Listeria booriae]MBC6151148.1 hypothetical protein [Listeria booriae]
MNFTEMNHRKLTRKINSDLIRLENNLNGVYLSKKKDELEAYRRELLLIAGQLSRLTDDSFERVLKMQTNGDLADVSSLGLSRFRGSTSVDEMEK